MQADAAAAQKLLDFSQPIDVALLDAVVSAFYAPAVSVERTQAQEVLNKFKEHPQAWTKVDAILEQSQSEQTKFFALTILEELIKFRWLALPADQRENIKNFISNLIISISNNETAFKSQRTFLNKLDLVLVQVLKHDWPSRWASFIPDIVGASKTSESLCENSMVILKLLSEEIFDFAQGELVQQKELQLKNSLNDQFMYIFELCMYVLTSSHNAELVWATLDTLRVYLTWMPMGYIFTSNMVQRLLELFPHPKFRNVALQCLTEIAALREEEHEQRLADMYKVFMQSVQAVLPPTLNVAEAYNHGSSDDQAFVQNLALFLTSYFRNHIQHLEAEMDMQQLMFIGLEYLVRISYVDNVEVFKTCLDYWNFFVPDIYSSACSMEASVYNAAPFFGRGPEMTRESRRKVMFSGTLSQLRQLMICRMAKPEEVIVVEDDNGMVVRETVKDSDVLNQYRTMRETLVYLAHLDHEDAELQMLEKLRIAMTTCETTGGQELDRESLNTLCWAIGSITGSMQEEQENKFLVTVIRDLLNLTELTKGKDNKAIIASNIMYVVGQYPRFLRAHWKFLKTVVNKLFEFMHESHPGVQDMACDTFLKICNKCKRKFILQQVGEEMPFIVELLIGLPETIRDLEVHQVNTFYEAVGLIIVAETNEDKRREYLGGLMRPPNETWQQVIAMARQDVGVLKDPATMRRIGNVLQTNVSVCQSLGVAYVTQLQHIYHDMLLVYKLYSELISQAIAPADSGPYAARQSVVKHMRSVKKATLRLIETFVEKSDPNTAQLIVQDLVPPLLDPVLDDYARNVPDARDPEVLSLFAMIISKLQALMELHVPRIFAAVFECTLQMITRNFEDYPDHRLKFFHLLHAITNHCFQTMVNLNQVQIKLVMDSIFWAIRHAERNIADTGLQLLNDMLDRFQQSEFATAFYQQYYLTILHEIFAVMTDLLHKPGFKMHCKILQHLFALLRTDVLKGPLWPAEKGPTAYPNNAAFIKGHMEHLLSTSFPNMAPPHVQACVEGMMTQTNMKDSKHHMRDFLIQTKQVAPQDADLFAEEIAAQQALQQKKLAQIPGMVPQD